MSTIPIRIVVEAGGRIPEYQTPGAAGCDVCCAEAFRLAPGERKMVATGLRIAVPVGFEAQVRPRSGLAIKHGVSMVNTPGTIDSDYRGPVNVLLINHGQEAVEFHAGDRIGQLVINAVVQADWVQVEELDETQRGMGGFGSTGLA